MAIAVLVTVLVLCVAALASVLAQVRCIDAAREAARLAARGDEAAATTAVRRLAPDGAVLDLRRDGEFVVAKVSSDGALPGLTLSAEAVSLAEPGG